MRARESSRLGEFLESYEASRTDIKPQTVTHWGHTIRNLLDFFGTDKSMREVEEENAVAFRDRLVQQGLAEATVQ